jgi:hypothetical protein
MEEEATAAVVEVISGAATEVTGVMAVAEDTTAEVIMAGPITTAFTTAALTTTTALLMG